MVTTTKYNRCKECPFARKSWPGYLGEVSGEPEVFLDQLETGHLPCHLTVDWEQEEPDYSKSHECVGALQFMNNSCKRSKFDDERLLQDKYGKSEEVFHWKSEFIQHHSESN